MKIFWLEFFQKIISCAARLLDRLEYVANGSKIKFQLYLSNTTFMSIRLYKIGTLGHPQIPSKRCQKAKLCTLLY